MLLMIQQLPVWVFFSDVNKHSDRVRNESRLGDQGNFCHFIMEGTSAAARVVISDVIPPGPINIVCSENITIKVNNIQIVHKNRVNDTLLMDFQKDQRERLRILLKN